MKTSPLLSMWLVLLFSVVPAHSATQYVTDDIEVMVRTGPGMDHKIIATPRSGTQMEILEVLPTGWHKVRLPDKKEGWMVGRYLSSGPPSSKVIAELKAEVETLKQELKTLTEANGRLKQERDEFQSALYGQTKVAEGLKGSYETLRNKDPDFLALKAANKEASDMLIKMTRRQAELAEKLEDLQSGEHFKWFLAGAGILLLGFLIGFRARRTKRRPSLL